MKRVFIHSTMKIRDSYIYQPFIGNGLSIFLATILLSTSTYINGEHGVWRGPLPITLGILIGMFWCVRLHAYREAIRIEVEKKAINHKQRMIVRGLIFFFAAFIIHIYGDGFGWLMFGHIVMSVLYMSAIFWILFDLFLNHDRDKPIFYVSKWYGTSKIDKFFSRFNSPVLWLAAKVVLFIFTLALYTLSL